MEIRNRMPDVIKLRCNACQEFLKMIVQEGWQEKLYKKADFEVNKGTHKDSYNAAYGKMRELGDHTKYTIDDMDMTIMAQLLLYVKGAIPEISDATKGAIRQLAIDRNVANHSNENEAAEELYLRGLLALCDIRAFITSVDQNETFIDDETRRNYRSKYIAQIDDLKETLDNERIELVQNTKKIEKHISLIQGANDPYAKWTEILGVYLKEVSLNHDFSDYHEFVIKASNSGIFYAHGPAASYYFEIKNYAEWERRLRLMLAASENTLTMADAHEIIGQIILCQMQDNPLPSGIQEIAEILIKKGFPIEITDSGQYLWKKK